MLRTVCKSKIHRATVTEANLQYTGSLTLDAELMRAADLVPYEQVHVVDINNGERLVTYCIEGPAGSGTVCINGAAARLVSAGDRIIIIAYAQLTPEELQERSPKIVLLDEQNRIQEVITDAILS
jgi:aspartate 1-decarboxylase